MSFYKEVPGRKTTLESTIKFDTTPTEGSTNPVTSEGVKIAIDGAVGDASEALQEQIDDIAEKAGSGYIPKGEASVATLNGLSDQENGDLYTLTDAGTLTDGSLAVVAGDTVAWDATNSVWYKAMNYAPAQYGMNEVHNLATTITAFRTDDVIPVDGPSGTAKMGKDDLLKETAALPLSKVDELKSNTFPYIDFSNPTIRYIERAGGVYSWAQKKTHNHVVQKIDGQTKFRILGNAGYWSFFTFLKSYDFENVISPSPNPPDFATGWVGETRVDENTLVEVDIPSDANYVYIRTDTNNEIVRTPQYAYCADATNILYRVQNLEADDETLKHDVDNIEEVVDGIIYGNLSTTVPTVEQGFPNRVSLPIPFEQNRKYKLVFICDVQGPATYFTLRDENDARLTDNFGRGTIDRVVEFENPYSNAVALSWHVDWVPTTSEYADVPISCKLAIYDVTDNEKLSTAIPRIFAIEDSNVEIRLSYLEDAVEGVVKNNVNVRNYPVTIRHINWYGSAWQDKSSRNHICIPIPNGVDAVNLKPSEDYACYYAFLASYDVSEVVSSDPPPADFATGYSRPASISAGAGAVRISIPSDANWLYLEVNAGYEYECYPLECGIYKAEECLESRVDELEKNIKSSAGFVGFDSLTTICHRGNCGVSNVPENSIHSITAAYMQGQKFVECDVKLTYDGQYVIMHDNTINRTMVNTDGTAIVGDVAVSSKTLAQLESDYIYKTSITKYATKITTFTEWLERVRELKLIPLLHNLPSSLVPQVVDAVGENFIYMGGLAGCRLVRSQSSGCLIIYQYAAQEDASHAIADSDIPAVIADMKSIGGLVAYSSMYAVTFSDAFIEALTSNGFGWQYSTQAPQDTAKFAAKGMPLLLTNNWSNDKLSYRSVWRMADDLSNITHLHEEDGCLKILAGESVAVEIQHNTNIKASLVIDGSVSVSVGGYSVAMSSNGFAAMLFGMNGLSGTSTITITATADTLIRDIDIATN